MDAEWNGFWGNGGTPRFKEKTLAKSNSVGRVWAIMEKERFMLFHYIPLP